MACTVVISMCHQNTSGALQDTYTCGRTTSPAQTHTVKYTLVSQTAFYAFSAMILRLLAGLVSLVPKRLFSVLNSRMRDMDAAGCIRQLAGACVCS